MTFLGSHREFHCEIRFIGKLSSVGIPFDEQLMLDSP